MKVSYNWLQTYFDKKLPEPEKLAELLSAHAFEVEGMEKAPTDTTLDIKVLPDRAHYALSHKGIAGEVAAITKTALKAPISPKIAITASVPKVAVNASDAKICPRYMARRIDGVHTAESPKWLRDYLEAIGQRSINSVVDSTNIVMFDLGQPLHAFDADKVQGAITVRKAKAGESIELLPEKTTVDGEIVFKERSFVLSESDIIIADDIGPLVIAGVKGGKRAEVSESTKSIIIEAANFNPTLIRRTSVKYNLRNDSSKRFENEITPALAAEAMERVTALVVEISPEAKIGAVTDVYPNPVKQWTIEADSAYMNAVTGLNLTIDQMKEILESLQCRVEVKGAKLLVTPPLNRLDIMIAEDVADEIVRMYGYDELAAKDTPTITAVPMDKIFYWSEKVKNILVGLGFSETLLYTLVPKGAFEVLHPLASDKSALRERIAPKMSESLIANARNAELLGLETIKIFEIGKVFPKTGEKTALCMGTAQLKKKKGVTSESVLKEVVAALESKLDAKLEGKIENGPYGAVIEIDFDKLVSVFKTGDIKDLDFVALSKDKKYVPFSPYPYIVRDIAMFVPAGISDGDVSNTVKAAAQKAAGKLLVKGPDLFDRFEKDGRVSYAFRMIFQSFEKTLEDADANAFMAQIYDVVKGKGWEVR